MFAVIVREFIPILSCALVLQQGFQRLLSGSRWDFLKISSRCCPPVEARSCPKGIEPYPMVE